MGQSYLKEMIAKLFALTNAEIPVSVLESAKDCLLDTVGCTIAGAALLREKLTGYMAVCGNGSAHALSFSKTGISCMDAAFVNGLSSHVAELDDGHRFAMLHPGSPVISALMALASTGEIDGEALLRGAVAGYEAAIRLAQMVQPAHKKRGYHASGTCGAFGAAMAIATARGYDVVTIENTASAALTSAGGLLEMIEGSSALKPYNCAKAAAEGILAANSARAGLQGPADALGGKRGFLEVLGEGVDRERFDRILSLDWQIPTIYRKPYAACRHSHAAIEAALMILYRDAIDIENIRKVRVRTYDLAVFGHDHTEIEGTNSAKMSIPYGVAVALIEGKAGLQEFAAEKVQDERVLALAKKVAVQESAELSALVPGKRAAIVDIEDGGGAVYTARVDYPKGEPENPLDQEELLQKFLGLAGYAGKSEAEAMAIAEAITHVDSSLGILMELL